MSQVLSWTRSLLWSIPAEHCPELIYRNQRCMRFCSILTCNYRTLFAGDLCGYFGACIDCSRGLDDMALPSALAQQDDYRGSNFWLSWLTKFMGVCLQCLSQNSSAQLTWYLITAVLSSKEIYLTTEYLTEVIHNSLTCSISLNVHYLPKLVCCTGQYHEGVRAKWLAEKAGHRYRHPYDVGIYTNLVTVSSFLFLFRKTKTLRCTISCCVHLETNFFLAVSSCLSVRILSN
jgi:hypothetical protein